jgi:hypothetical protein
MMEWENGCDCRHTEERVPRRISTNHRSNDSDGARERARSGDLLELRCFSRFILNSIENLNFKTKIGGLATGA